MKAFFGRWFGLALSFGMMVSLSSCVPNPVAPPVPTYLVSNPSPVSLTKTDSTKLTSFRLTCGCTFPMTITSYWGDTTEITYAPLDALQTMVTPHNILITGHPTGLAPKKYTTHLAVSAPDDSGGSFFDTLTVEMTL